MKKEYLIIGDDNYWYASGITSLKIAKSEAKEIIKNGEIGKGNELPEKLYIFKAEEIEQVEV